MHRAILSFVGFALLWAWISTPISAQFDRGNRIEAVVNDKVVTRFDVMKKLAEDVPDFDKSSASQQKGFFQTALITKVLAILREDAAKKAGVKLGEEQIRGALNRRIEQEFGGEDGFEEFLRDEGLSRKSFVENFRRESETNAWLRVVSGRGAAARLSEDLRPLYDITVTPKEMRNFYRRNKDREFTKKDRVQVRFIKQYAKAGRKNQRIARTRIRGLKASLATGADFAVLAKKHSDDPTSENGGLVEDWVEKGNTDAVPAKIEELLFAEDRAIGKVLGPIKIVNAYWLVKIEKIETAKVLPFSEVQGTIKQVLIRKKNNAALRRVLRDLVERSYIHPPKLKRTIQSQLAEPIER